MIFLGAVSPVILNEVKDLFKLRWFMASTSSATAEVRSLSLSKAGIEAEIKPIGRSMLRPYNGPL